MIPKFKKKAVLFSLISILFAILFITLYSQNFSTTYEDRLPSNNIRIKVMDTYAKNFEKYIGDSIKVSSYKALNAITIYRYNNSKFFNNFEEFNNTFHECVKCGYINCSNKNITNDCKIGTDNLEARLNNITTLSKNQMNIKTEYTINSITIEQKYAFEVEVKVNISYNITDNAAGEDYAKWTKEKIITQPVTIIGLLDPKGYINDSTNTYKRIISRYRGTCEYNASCWNRNNMEEFYKEYSFRYYKESESFLQRYWNNLTPSDCCGIETILHPSEINSINKNNSYIDTLYWNGINSCNSTQKILNISLNSEDVHLDEGTAARYQVTNSSTKFCPT